MDPPQSSDGQAAQLAQEHHSIFTHVMFFQLEMATEKYEYE